MRNSQGRKWMLVQDHSQELQSRVHGSCDGPIDILSENALKSCAKFGGGGGGRRGPWMST